VGVERTQFYATAAQVIPTLLVVLALELRRLEPAKASARRRQFWKGFIAVGLVITATGEAAALLGTQEPQPDVIFWIVAVAFCFQLALILGMALIALDAPPEVGPAAPSTAAPRPSFVWLAILWLLVRRR